MTISITGRNARGTGERLKWMLVHKFIMKHRTTGEIAAAIRQLLADNEPEIYKSG